MPLYRHLFRQGEPTLCFIGLPFRVIPFPLCDAQAALVAAVLSGRVSLPPAAEQAEETQAALRAMRRAGGRNFHLMGAAQWGYMRGLLRTARGDESGEAARGAPAAASNEECAERRRTALRHEREGLRDERRLTLLGRMNAEIGSRRRLVPLSYRSSEYSVHIDEADDENGGWFEVRHQTHSVERG